MDSIPFAKMSGCGNDFVIIDNRTGTFQVPDLTRFIQAVCEPKMSVGADGMIFLENSDQADFKWQFYNSDGSRAEMCGNGARCAARFACLKGIAGTELTFETDLGIIGAKVDGIHVKVRMPIVQGRIETGHLAIGQEQLPYDALNTGVPHVVICVEDVETVNVRELGRRIRFHEHFAPQGTNVNFVQILDQNRIAIRTYERGVEDETLACGTGCVAAGLIMAHRHGWPSPIQMLTRSIRQIQIHFSGSDGNYTDIFMEGEARLIYEGHLWPDAWEWKTDGCKR